MKIDSILDSIIDGTTKGVPAHCLPLAVRDIAAMRWNVLDEDLPLPVALLRRSALESNARWMEEYCRRTGVLLCPHGKTTMAPQLFARQLQGGCWGMTCATVEQLQVYRHFGVARVLFANQLVGRQNIACVLNELDRDPAFEFWCLVDSVETVEILEAAVRAHGGDRPVAVLLELGVAGGRTGARSAGDARLVLDAIAASQGRVVLHGLEAYEGIVPGMTAAEIERGVTAIFDLVTEVAAVVMARGMFARTPVILSAGGTNFFDTAASRLKDIELGAPSEVVIRSGCYLTFDDGALKRDGDRIAADAHTAAVQPALEVWAYVQSIPEAGLALLTVGKRDVGFDEGLPVAKLWHRPGAGRVPAVLTGHHITGLNDQHAYLALPAGSPLRVGDIVGLGICHPCTTFDRWRMLMMVDDDYTVVEGIRTFF